MPPRSFPQKSCHLLLTTTTTTTNDKTILEDSEGEALWSDSMDVLPELKAVLIGSCQILQGVDDFSICGDVIMPHVLARRWIARLEEIPWRLDRSCQNDARVSMNGRSTNDVAIHNFCSRFPNCEAAQDVRQHHLLQVDETVLFGRNCDDDLDWWFRPSFLEVIAADVPCPTRV